MKQDAPVMVVLGNPPYSGVSTNQGEWIGKLLKGEDTRTGEKTENYFEVDGKPLGERKVWLNDDYVKFIRFAQWRIERTGYGVLAFVTNHRYLDNVTFRGMRQSLMNTFDEIFVLDLHGSVKDGLRTPSGGNDENVFDIEQGVAVGVFIRRGNTGRTCKVYRADMWGTRESKYKKLWGHEVSVTEWTELEPESPYYFFLPRDNSFRDEYLSSLAITKIMPVNSTAVITARDEFAVDFDHTQLLNRLADLRNGELSDQLLRERYFSGKGSKKYPPGDTRGWKLPEARKRVLNDELWQDRVTPYNYRPFDERLIYFASWIVDWPRPEVMQHMVTGANYGLQTCRQTLSSDWRHVFLTDSLSDDSYISNKSKERSYLFPLYLYPETTTLFDQPTPNPGGRRPNLSPAFVEDVSKRLGLTFVDDGKGDLESTFGPEDVFAYIYAVFHSPTYRERYAEFLKIDFPRVPLTSKLELFRSLVAKGETLVPLHLMERVGSVMTSYPVEGDNVVDKVSFKEDEGGKTGRVYINSTQYFDGVPLEVWEFHVGGYQVLHKWLKDRKGRTLAYEDLRHYGFIVSALFETIGTMREIDEAVEGAGGWPLE